MLKFTWTAYLTAPLLIAGSLIASASLANAKPEQPELAHNTTSSSFLIAQAVPAGTSTNSSQSLEQIENYSSGYSIGRPIVNTMGQATSVSQFSDVQPTDWAFQALQSLVERYGCVAGYPDSTYRGNRAMTRYEFAAGLNACMDRVNELIAAATADLVRKEDLATLRKLQDEFAAELKTLRGRVDSLEARTATLEAQQFSTTTKLRGEVLFAIADAFGDASNTPSSPVSSSDNYNTTFSYRVRLNFDTSFTGKDVLRTRLEAGNTLDVNYSSTASSATAPGREGRFAFTSAFAGSAGSVNIDTLSYTFPVGDNTRVILSANNNFFDAITDPITPFASTSAGSVSRYGRFHPLIFRTGEAKGIAAQFKLSDAFRLDLAYHANTANTPTSGSGLFAGSYSTLAHLIFTPSREFKFSLAYVHGYNNGTGGLNHGTGSLGANLQSSTTGNAVSAVSYNSYGAQFNYQLSQGFAIGGWFGFTAGRALGLGDAEIWDYALTLAFPDLGGKGNLGGIVFGSQPYLGGTSNTITGLGVRQDPSIGFHIEGFYSYRLADNIILTPGVIWLTAPNQNANLNGNIIVGLVRMGFLF